jgi:hypothetical protein
VNCIATPSPLADPTRSVGAFTAAEVERLAQMEHERWMGDLREAGFTYGPRHDEQAKTHPGLVPFDQLSDDDQEKDRAAVRNLPEMMVSAGFEITRVESPIAANGSSIHAPAVADPV